MCQPPTNPPPPSPARIPTSFGSIEAVILAGGLSRRMGRDKTQLRLGQRSLLSLAREPARILGLTLRVIRRDRVRRCGPLGGILTSLQTSKADILLFLAADMPFLSPTFIQRLLRKAHHALATFTVGPHGPGFPFVLHRDALPAVLEQYRAGQFPLHRLALRLRARRFKPTAKELPQLDNINTPQDLDRARLKTIPDRTATTITRSSRPVVWTPVLWILLTLLTQSLRADTPPPEQLLPPDTLAVLTAPDARAAWAALDHVPMVRLWRSEPILPFRNHFVQQLRTRFLDPMERDHNVAWTNYTRWVQGQITLAILPDGSENNPDGFPAWVLLVDARSQQAAMERNLTEVRNKLREKNHPSETTTIRKVEFTTVPIAPGWLRSLAPPGQANPAQATATPTADPAPSTHRLHFGSAGSLFIAGSKPEALERILANLSTHTNAVLASNTLFQADYTARFQSSPIYAWFQLEPLVGLLRRSLEKTDPKARNPLFPAPDRLIGALGLNGVKSLAIGSTAGPDGAGIEAFLASPEAQRAGLFRLLSPEPKPSGPPPFLGPHPAKFIRWRRNLPTAWTNLETVLQQLSPQVYGLIQMSQAVLGKDQDPNFDFKKSFIDNLGDDIISLTPAASLADTESNSSGTSITLVAIKNPEELPKAIRALLAILPVPGGPAALQMRTFQGKSVFSIPLSASEANTQTPSDALHFGMAHGYAAFSSDPRRLEAFLASSPNPTPLEPSAASPPWPPATARVGGTDSGLFIYQDSVESARRAFQDLKRDPKSTGAFEALGAWPAAALAAGLHEWFDFALLPNFDRVVGYFSHRVWNGTADDRGLRLRMFTPTPPAPAATPPAAAAPPNNPAPATEPP